MGWRHLFRRAERVAESAEEIQFHLDTEIEDNIARGMSAEEARTAARRKLGNPALIREDVYRMNSFDFLETVWQDIRYSLRAMRKSPLFTLTAVFTLALGIGGNAAMFSVIRTILLKPLQYRNPDRLVQLSLENPRQNMKGGSFSVLRLEEIGTSAKSFNGVGAFLKFTESVSLSGRGRPEALKAARVSANFLDILGVKPLVGRSFLPEADTPGGPAVAMISAGLWRRRFESDPQIEGKTTTLNSMPYAIVGVLPDDFTFPFVGTDVWLPKPTEWSILPARYWPYLTLLNGFARLRPHVTLAQAQTELDVLNARYIRAHPERIDAQSGVWLRATPLRNEIVANLRPTLLMLFGAVGFVLLIACANVAGLLLARAATRSREFAVRAAVGAPRGRLIRQLLVESMVMAIGGGAFGTLLASWVLKAIRHVSVLRLPGVGEIRPDGMMLGFTIALSVATGILFGLVPSLRASRPDLNDELRESGAGALNGLSARRRVFGITTRGILVIGQISLSIVLLIGAMLLMKSFANLRSVAPGFQPSNLLTMKISLPPARYNTDQKKAAFFRELVYRANETPGVQDATVMMSLPTTRDWLGTNVLVEGQPMVDGSKQPTARVQSITPGYFRTLKIPLRRGREFAPRDNAAGAQPAVIINESFARRFWPAYPLGGNPVGQHLREGLDHTGWMQIVGVVADVHENGLDAEPGPEFYVPTIVHPPQTAYLVVRAARNPLHLANAIRRQVLAIDSEQPVSEIKTMDEVLDATLGQRRLTMLLLGSFAGMALLLAVIGLYGVIAYSASQRTQELGIRRALGAQQGDILRLVMSQALGLTTAGIVIGVAGAFALTRLMRNLLFQVSVTDPATFVGIAFLFLFIALIASYVPARRAAQIDPMAALRIG